MFGTPVKTLRVFFFLFFCFVFVFNWKNVLKYSNEDTARLKLQLLKRALHVQLFINESLRAAGKSE